MRMSVYDDDRSSQHVRFTPEPVYSRLPRLDEKYVMERFHRHAIGCKNCHDPYYAHISGATLCDRGHMLAQDVARYMFSERGRAYSMIDRESLRQRVQVEIPPRFDTVRGLLRAASRGLRIQKPPPTVSHDHNHRYHDDDREYFKDQTYQHNSNCECQNKYHYPDKRQSLPASLGRVWEKDVHNRKHKRSCHEDDPVYYNKPSKHGSEKRIPQGESPRRESTRRMILKDHCSLKHESPSSYHSLRYKYPQFNHTSRHNSPETYRSSRHTSPESYQWISSSVA